VSYGQQAGQAGVSVETVLSQPNCRPGGVVAGKVHLTGGPQPAEIRNVTLALMPRMQNGYGGETAGPEVYRGALTRAFRLEAGQRRDLSFSIPLPYELPFTTVLGRELPGFTIGLCTEVDVQGAPDPGDVDPISVEPLKSQQWVLAAIARLGFRIENVAFEQAKLSGVTQRLPFYQQIRLAPPGQYAGRIGEVGLSFVAGPRHMEFVLVADRDDGHGRFKAEHPEAAETDWFSKISQWLEEAASRPRAQSSPPQGSFQSPPLPPPGGGPSTFPPPPAQHGAPAAAPAPAAAYGDPGAYGHPGQGQQFPPPAPGPGQSPTPPHPPPSHGHAPPPPPPAHGSPPPAPPGPGPGWAYPPAPPGPGGQQYPPPPAPPGPPPPVHHHHGAPPYPRGHHPRHGWGAAGAVGGAAAAGVAGGLAAGAAVDAFGNVIGGAANVAGYAAGVPYDQFGDAAAGFAGGLAADAAGAVANEVAGEAAGAVGEILGGLLGGLFG
jgi:sporulation-control protein spo0M